MYHSTPHNTTGVSPAELLYGRKIRTKLPDLQTKSVDDFEDRDRDSEQKEKGKIYWDKKKSARQNEINPGNRVLVRQEEVDKCSTKFYPKPFTVVDKRGNQVVVQSHKM